MRVSSKSFTSNGDINECIEWFKLNCPKSYAPISNMLDSVIWFDHISTTSPMVFAPEFFDDDEALRFKLTWA